TGWGLGRRGPGPEWDRGRLPDPRWRCRRSLPVRAETGLSVPTLALPRLRKAGRAPAATWASEDRVVHRRHPRRGAFRAHGPRASRARLLAPLVGRTRAAPILPAC